MQGKNSLKVVLQYEEKNKPPKGETIDVQLLSVVKQKEVMIFALDNGG